MERRRIINLFWNVKFPSNIWTRPVRKTAPMDKMVDWNRDHFEFRRFTVGTDDLPNVIIMPIVYDNNFLSTHELWSLMTRHWKNARLLIDRAFENILEGERINSENIKHFRDVGFPFCLSILKPKWNHILGNLLLRNKGSWCCFGQLFIFVAEVFVVLVALLLVAVLEAVAFEVVALSGCVGDRTAAGVPADL